MSKPLIVIFVAVVLDAIGIGLIFPILPALLRDVTHADNVAAYIGVMTALYAAMQFVFAPVLGSLSDRLGRRPVLLISLAGAAVNYLFLAIAPSLWMLLLGRAIAGLTSANLSVATAYITDISAEHKRARRFGLFNAMFGIGFIIGPVLGGVLGDHWLRLPFIAAAVLNACNLLLAFFVLPESREPSRAKIDLAALNPLRPLRWLLSMKHLLPSFPSSSSSAPPARPTAPPGRCGAAMPFSGTGCGSACRWAASAPARRLPRLFYPVPQSGCSASAPPSSSASPAPALHWSSWHSPPRAG
jgi:DHA1 family tetracycline resistance protein-like MFS transporter